MKSAKGGVGNLCLDLKLVNVIKIAGKGKKDGSGKGASGLD